MNKYLFFVIIIIGDIMNNKFLFLVMLLILPITGKCLTPEEKLDKIKSVKEGDTYYIDVK